MYAVRECSIDFVEQSHINNTRTWMAAVCHEIKETVSPEMCKCGERYELWGRQPASPCSKCAKIHFRKASPGETGTEEGEKKGKRAQCESSGGKGERKREKIQHPQEAVEKCGLGLDGQGGLGMSLVTRVPRNAKTKADNSGQFELNPSS